MRHKAKWSLPSELFSVPVDAQVANDCSEPCGKRRRSVAFKFSEPFRTMINELLANELKAVCRMICVSLEMANDLIDMRCVFGKELSPSLLPVG